MIRHCYSYIGVRRTVVYQAITITTTTTSASRKHHSTLWCDHVIFADEEPCQGSVDIDTKNGTIGACHPGESWKEVQQRQPKVQKLGHQTVLSPGLVDVHVHISALSRTWEGYTSATKAAAAGGITTIMGMPLNSIPATTTLEAIDMERHAATREADLYVDVGLWGGVVPENTTDDTWWQVLQSPYIFGLKAFLAPLPPAAGYQAIPPEILLRIAKQNSTSKPILVHGELMTEEQSEQHVHQAYCTTTNEISLASYANHLHSRPAQWEQEAVRVVAQAAEYCKMHIVHLSDAEGCRPILEQQQQHQQDSSNNLSVETCPHYLLLDDTQIKNGDTRVKCFPPIRTSRNREVLWELLDMGMVQIIASDHSPCEPSMRLPGNFRDAWGGLSGLQYQLPATWTEASRRGVSPWLFTQWWSTNPSKLLLGEKFRGGGIQPGSQANLCWWDPNYVGAPNTYSQEYHHWKNTTYFADNPTMKGRVLGTWVRGHMVYDGIKDQHDPIPRGKLLRWDGSDD